MRQKEFLNFRKYLKPI